MGMFVYIAVRTIDTKMASFTFWPGVWTAGLIEVQWLCLTGGDGRAVSHSKELRGDGIRARLDDTSVLLWVNLPFQYASDWRAQVS